MRNNGDHTLNLIYNCKNIAIYVNNLGELIEQENLQKNKKIMELYKTSHDIIAFRFHITEWGGDDNVFNGIVDVLDELAIIYMAQLKIKVNRVYILYGGEQKIFAQFPSTSGLDDNGLDLFTDTIVTYLPGKHFDFEDDIDIEQILNVEPSVKGLKIVIIVDCNYCEESK